MQMMTDRRRQQSHSHDRKIHLDPSRTKNRNATRSWQPKIYSWEKKFCYSTCSIPWRKLLETKKLMCYYDKIVQWDDSAGEEAFFNAKARFWAEINGCLCDIPLPDPNVYIDEVDWNCSVDPSLMVDLSRGSPISDDEKGKPSWIKYLSSDKQIVPPGWGDDLDMIVPTGWGDAEEPVVPKEEPIEKDDGTDVPDGQEELRGGDLEKRTKHTGVSAIRPDWMIADRPIQPTGWDDSEFQHEVLGNNNPADVIGWGDENSWPKDGENSWNLLPGHMEPEKRKVLQDSKYVDTRTITAQSSGKYGGYKNFPMHRMSRLPYTEESIHNSNCPQNKRKDNFAHEKPEIRKQSSALWQWGTVRSCIPQNRHHHGYAWKEKSIS